MTATSLDCSDPARPSPRRLLLHVGLALLSTPVPGGLLISGRLLIQRRWRSGLAAIALTLLVTGAGVGAVFWLPARISTTAGLILLSWAAVGAALAFVEARCRVGPGEETVGEPQAWSQVATWTCATLVALIPWAFFLASVFSRWGMEFFGKPSMAKLVVLMALLFLAPLGAVVGLARALLRRPHRPGPPVVFGLANAVVLGTLIGLVLLRDWLVKELAGFESIDTTPALSEAWFLVLMGLLAGPLLWLAHYLSEASGVRDFGVRWTAAAGVIFLLILNIDLLTSTTPVAWRLEAAKRAAAAGSHEAASHHWSWVVARAPAIRTTRTAIETGAREALRARRPEMARRLLESADAEFGYEVSSIDLRDMAARLLRSDLDLAEVSEAPVRPIRREGYLDVNWSALLTAVRAARPDLRESELKSRLRDVSLSAESIKLEAKEPMLALRFVAGLFDCVALAIPFERHREALDAGLPALFLSSRSGYWRLLHWTAPASDAVQWLDYADWGDTGEELDRASRRDLLSAEGDEGVHGRRIVAAIGQLGARSRLAERLNRQGGWVFVVVRSEDERRWLETFPESRLRARELERTEASRAAFYQRAFDLALTIAGDLPPGWARDELLAAAWLGSESRWYVAPGLEEEARAAAEDRLSPGRLERGSPWFLEHLLTLSESELACGRRQAALDASLAIRPSSTALLTERLELAVAERDLGVAAELVLRRVVTRRWSSAAILEALQLLAPVKGAGDSPASREALELLLARLPLVPETEDGSPRRRAVLAPYCAARAALTGRVEGSVTWWRRAVELEPLEASYRARLAEALEATGQTWLAARQRERSAMLVPVARCATSLPDAGAVVASGMATLEVGR